MRGAPAAAGMNGEREVLADAFYAYPKNGQTERQQWKDRSECLNTATSQTGVDPTQPIGPMAPSGAASRLVDYRRAFSACLEARGYSVSFAETSPLWG